MGHLLRCYVDPNVAQAALYAINACYCKPPLPDRDIEKIAFSVAGREMRRRDNAAQRAARERIAS
jgi:hypothetical protein